MHAWQFGDKETRANSWYPALEDLFARGLVPPMGIEACMFSVLYLLLTKTEFSHNTEHSKQRVPKTCQGTP